MLALSTLAAVVAVGTFLLGLVLVLGKTSDAAGGGAIVLSMVIIFGWQTFADRPLIPYVVDAWRHHLRG